VSLRRQLPAYSPLTLDAVMAGGAALLGGAGRSRAGVSEAVAAWLGARALLATDSGTSALAVAIRGALAPRPGAAVALPAYCCYDVATAADGAGAAVLLYDLDPSTLAPDGDSLRRALSQGAAAVVVAHLYGVPVDLGWVAPLVAEAGAVLIEDAAQGAGAMLGGRPLGSSGSLAVLSFGRGKGITGGHGGALLAHDETGVRVVEEARATLAGGVRGWSTLIAVAAQWALSRPALYALPAALPFVRLGETIYRTATPPARPSAVSTAVLSRTWPLAAAEAETRRRNAAELLRAVAAGAPLVPPRVPDAAVPGYLRLPLRAGVRARAMALEGDARALGVMPGYPLALCDLGGFAGRCANRESGFAGARALAASLCTLPTHSRLSAADVGRLCRWVRALPD
jgi:perosamine synthetase